MRTKKNGFDFNTGSIICNENTTSKDKLNYRLWDEINNGVKLNKEQLIEIANTCGEFTFEEIKEQYNICKLAVKEKKAKEKLEAFRTENCCFNYKGTEIAFKPCYCVIDNRKVVIWKTNLDKNAVYYLYENDGAIAIKAVACVTEKNKSYTYRNDLVKANTGKIKKMMIDMLAGCNFEQFFERASKFKGFREVEVKGALKSITL